MRVVAFPLVAVSFIAACVTLASLSSLQRQCDNVPIDRQLHLVDEPSGDVLDVTGAVFGAAFLRGVHGFSAEVLSCSAIYRHQWFVIAFQMTACLLGLLACASDVWYRQVRFGLLGLFVMLSVLFIRTSESFLTATSVAFYREVPQARRTLSTLVAGSIATTTLDVLLVLALGLRCKALRSRSARSEWHEIAYGKALPL